MAFALCPADVRFFILSVRGEREYRQALVMVVVNDSRAAQRIFRTPPVAGMISPASGFAPTNATSSSRSGSTSSASHPSGSAGLDDSHRRIRHLLLRYAIHVRLKEGSFHPGRSPGLWAILRKHGRAT